MPVGHQFVQPVADFVQLVLRMLASGRTVSEGAEAVYQGKSRQEQEGEPDIIRSQWLGQNGKQHAHTMDLPDSQL